MVTDESKGWERGNGELLNGEEVSVLQNEKLL